MTIELRAGSDDSGRRLDRILRKALPDYSLSLIHRLLRQGKALVDGKKAGPGERIQPGALIKVELEALPQNSTQGQPAKKPHTPLPVPEILWQGSGIIVFNKPPGLASHGESSLDTLVNAWLEGKLPPSLSFKPGPLHRLDKPTSGAIAFSESLEGARLFSRLLREHKVQKTYLALVEGCIKKEETWQDGLVRDTSARKTFTSGGTDAKNALTSVKAIAANSDYTLVQAHIITGRTHQIRSQAAAHGHPLAGDVKYGGRRFTCGKITSGFLLHAWKIEFTEGAENLPHIIIAPPPELFLTQINILFGSECVDKIV